MKTLKFHPRFFEFNVGQNFTFRRGAKTEFQIGEHIKLTNCLPQCGGVIAYVDNIQHIRYCDIPSFEKWHLFCVQEPIAAMKAVYGETFDPLEIVTLIWFTLEGEAE